MIAASFLLIREYYRKHESLTDAFLFIHETPTATLKPYTISFDRQVGQFGWFDRQVGQFGWFDRQVGQRFDLGPDHFIACILFISTSWYIYCTTLV